MTRVLVLNGPNLGRLGSREPDVYGTLDLSALRMLLTEQAGEAIDIDLRQTDDESQIVAWLHEAVDTRSHVVLNPAAFTHYSYALRDAAAQIIQYGWVGGETFPWIQMVVLAAWTVVCAPLAVKLFRWR
jgi:3-dehydroquinate dehydratase-2